MGMADIKVSVLQQEICQLLTLTRALNKLLQFLEQDPLPKDIIKSLQILEAKRI